MAHRHGCTCMCAYMCRVSVSPLILSRVFRSNSVKPWVLPNVQKKKSIKKNRYVPLIKLPSLKCFPLYLSRMYVDVCGDWKSSYCILSDKEELSPTSYILYLNKHLNRNVNSVINQFSYILRSVHGLCALPHNSRLLLFWLLISVHFIW